MQAEHMKCGRFEPTVAQQIRDTGRTNRHVQVGIAASVV